jgi:hypothetical protein
MAITTYSELQSAIGNWLNRSDLTTNIPDFIALAEADMARRLKHWRMENRSTAILDTQYSALPYDFIEPVRLFITSGDTYKLEAESQAQLLDRRSQAANTTGRPEYYTITSGAIEVFPTPSDSYTLELLYVSKIPTLTDSNTSNWVLQYSPDCYLYGALMHAAPFLEEDQRLGIWGALYDKAIDEINSENESAKFGGTGLRVKIKSY